MRSAKERPPKIIDGYIHFKWGETHHVHYLHQSTSSLDLSGLEEDVAMGRAERGMKQLILANYSLTNDQDEVLTENELEIVSHHFVFQAQE